MTKLDLYLLRSNMRLFFALLMLSLSILLMERLIRLTEILSNSDHVLLSAARLVTNLVPHYLELALPGALLITVIISVNRFSRTGEITALMSSGVSLYRIARPFLVFGLVMACLSTLMSGYLQPLSRYNYRQAVFELQQSSVVSAFKEFKFVQFQEQTIWSDSVDSSGTRLGETFLTEKRPDGSRRFLIGGTGELIADEQGEWRIDVRDAMIGELPSIYENGEGNRLSAGKIAWKLPTTSGVFRTRGKDQRELTLPELVSRSYLTGDYDIDPVEATADFHDRLSRSALLLVLPLIGIVLGLDLRRNPRAGGVIIGILVLLLIQKTFEFGLLRAERGEVAAWAGLWPITAVVGVVGLLLFHRAAKGHYSWNGIRLRRVPQSEVPEPTPQRTGSGS